MKGRLHKFEKTKDDITVIIKCPLNADLHSIVDMLDKEVDFGIQANDIPAWEFDQIIPICRMIEESRQKMYEKGLSDAMNAQSDVSETMEKTKPEGGTQNVT